MAGKMECWGLTDIGRRRQSNEDQFLIADLNKSMRVHQTSLGLDHQTRLFGSSQGKLLAVADGMGGHRAGERASQLVVDEIVTYVLNTLQWYFQLNSDGEEDFEDDLKAALRHCQQSLAQDVEAAPQRRGMGTTLTMAYVIWPRMYIVHVGDSRCYLLRDGRLKQLTRDHTVAQLYKESVTAEATGDSGSDRWSNVLWNVIGANNDDLEPEVYESHLELGDTVLLCTDGLTNHVPEDRLVALLERDQPASEACQQLVDEANRLGGSDNVTVIVSRFQDAAEEKQQAETTVDLSLEPTGSQSSNDTDPFIETSPGTEPRQAV